MGTYFHREKQADSLCKILDNDMKNALTNATQFKDSVKVEFLPWPENREKCFAYTKINSPK